MFFSGPEIASTLAELGVTHVIWIPDSALGPWEAALESSTDFRLLRVCREGEAWPLAAGLHLGGASPVIMMQTTGLFESGDAMRNVLFDLGLPVFAILGARSWLVEDSNDSARRFTQPVLDAWGIDHVLVASDSDKPKLAQHYRRSREAGVAAAVLIAEGRM
jgi:sulfopyruvate decarboxylase TPP-binding subunit